MNSLTRIPEVLASGIRIWEAGSMPACREGRNRAYCIGGENDPRFSENRIVQKFHRDEERCPW